MDRQTVAIEVKKALSETVLLSDGSRGYVITEVDGCMQEKWECHVCSRIITTERAMLMHLSHPLHMSKMRASHHPVENFKKKISEDDRSPKKNYEASKNKKEEKSWELSETIRPGEPVPPGMEDVVKKVCQIQETLDKHPGPLIGIEYIVELISTDEEAEPKYICLLCEKKGDPRSVMVHLASRSHALRYISCFFRTAGNALNMIPKISENRKGVFMAVQKISEEIEKHFGRLKPTLAAAESFPQQKYEILRSIDEKEHFRETPSTTFMDYCSPEKIKEYTTLAEAEFNNALKNRSIDENDMNMPNEKSENESSRNSRGKSGEPRKPYEPRHSETSSKLSFSIGKPERSFGRNKSGELSNSKDAKEEDEVIFVASSTDPIEIPSLSSISSASDDEAKGVKLRSRSRSRGRMRGRKSPLRRRSPPRRRSPHRDRDPRYRSRSRSRGRYYREKDRYSRSTRDRDLERIYGRERRSRSKDRIRYERGRSDRDRYRRSISIERERRRMSPRLMRDHSPQSKRKSPEHKKKRVLSEYEIKMDAYRAKLHDLEVEMDNKLKYYRERPEKHPQYSEEWKNFWNRRYKELQQSGKDPTGYDFKPEWIVFWDERVKKLHEEELLVKKEELKIFLPSEDKGPSCDLQDISPPTPESAKDVTVDDIKNTWKALTGTDIKAPSRVRSITPDTKSPVSRRSPSPWEERTKSWKSSSKYVADPPIVHCLRMLSVLEQQLGSLGPRALDLLSKAILMEKFKHNESMTLLQDPEIQIFFETVKEKIRGQLIAGIVVRHLVNSCRSLIHAIESMIAANPLKPKPMIQPKPTFSPLQPEPVKVAGVGMVNKMAVAQQIAEILISQGRTDVSQQELEELINAVVGIASNSNTNINQPPASFLSQLNIQKSTASSHINELLSNLISSAQQTVAPQAGSVFKKPVMDVPSVPEISTSHSDTSSLLNSQAVSSLISSQISMKPFTEAAVTAAKATVSEQTSPLPKENKSLTIDELEKNTDEDPKSNKVFDDDLKERLMKFKTLSRDEQQSLIGLLKELENKEPERVEKLRKYVTLGLTQSTNSSVTSKPETEGGRLSPFSSRAGGTNPAPEENKKSFLMDSDHEDDDDDYSVEDVYKSVSEKLKKKDSERKSDFRINPSELFDENTSSSRHSFSNSGRALSPTPYPVKSFNSEPRNNSSSHTKNDYSAYSVREPPSKPSPDRFPPPQPQQKPVDNTYKSSQWPEKSWENTGSESAQWPGNKSWSQGPQEVYPSGGRPASYSANTYEGGYSQNMPPYNASQGPYYGGDPNFSSSSSNGNPQYNPQPYQTAPPYDNNQSHVNYNYQGQGYYGNYRQY